MSNDVHPTQNHQNLPLAQVAQAPRILIMAAGTGGHVFPALAVADELTRRGAEVHWLGTPAGMENELVAKAGYPYHAINMAGMRGKGVARKLKIPFMLTGASFTARKIILLNNIDIVVGFGGYVTAPGGLAAKMTGTPLVIHEQNAIAGMSNRYLAKIATRVLQAFEGTFGDSTSEDEPQLFTVGNPVRESIYNIAPPEVRYDLEDDHPLKLLVVGGSLGAQVLNQTVPAALAILDKPMVVHHQSGRANFESTQASYDKLDKSLNDSLSKTRHKVTVMPFIDDMAQEYAWADIIVCRAGALTVSEIQNVGVAAIFIPLPHAVDDHQTANARYLAVADAAYLVAQPKFSAEYLKEILVGLDRAKCLDMAKKAKAQANRGSTTMAADYIWSLLR